MALTLSVVTPSYNQAAFLGATVDSVLAQDLQGVQYQVRDGASTDGTRALLQAYGDRLSWVSEPDGGQPDAIAKGFGELGGDILGWLNSDDLYAPDALATVREAFEADLGLDVLYGGCHQVDAEGTRLSDYRTRPFRLPRLFWDNTIAQPAAFFRRRAWDTVGGFTPGLQCAFDYDLWLRMALAGCRFRYLPVTLAAFRLHGASKSLGQPARCDTELAQVLTRTLHHPRLRNLLGAAYASTRARMHLRMARLAYLHGNPQTCRRHCLRALMWHPPLAAMSPVVAMLARGSKG
jgi:glycosyltransferase involved in cell wall biosynthesis